MNNHEILLAQSRNKESINNIIEHYNKTILKNNSFFLLDTTINDLIQEGLIGLLKAIKYFNPDRNTSFNTFANICIKRHIITTLKNKNSNKHHFLNKSISPNQELDIDLISSYKSLSLKFYSFENTLLGKELSKHLTNYLKNKLSDLEKIVYTYFCKGYSYIEISKFLDMTPKKIDNVIQRIKKKILTYLNSYKEI